MLKTIRLLPVLALIGVLLAPVVMAADNNNDAVPRCCEGDPGVFQAFGEREGIHKVMQIFMRKLMADERTRPFFEDSDRAKVVEHLTDQFCQAMGGPCDYQGRSMIESHAGQKIKREHFNAVVGILQDAMNERHIPVRAQNKVLAAFAPLHRQIEEQ